MLIYNSAFQKAPIPNVEDLPTPQFESEAKKTSIKVTKTTTAPIVEGTSVMPRQRPKGSASQPLSCALPLAISASPTNIPKKPQSPITTTETSTFAPNVAFQNFPPIQTTFQISPSSQVLPVTTNNAFNPTQTFFSPNSSQERQNNSLDNLFQSSVYPDPFRDESQHNLTQFEPNQSNVTKFDSTQQNITSKFDSIPANVTSKVEVESQQIIIASSINNIQIPDACILPEVKHISTVSYIPDSSSPTSVEKLVGNGNNKQKIGLNSKMESSSQCMMAETPPLSPTLTVPRGHRRNMSDTSAFNK